MVQREPITRRRVKFIKLSGCSSDCCDCDATVRPAAAAENQRVDCAADDDDRGVRNLRSGVTILITFCCVFLLRLADDCDSLLFHFHLRDLVIEESFLESMTLCSE